MGVSYFRRYRMEINLAGRSWPWLRLPPGYRLWPWDPSLLEAHAEAKYDSFREEIDADVFPCLGEYIGCCRLMREITSKPGFVPEATWLLVYTDRITQQREYCGTVQGIRDPAGMGAVQNLGITPAHRGRSLGTGLLHQALYGFRQSGLEHVYLEVTAENDGAIRLYRREGFQLAKTIFKPAEVACSQATRLGVVGTL